jgi:hypothetical protein
MTNKDTAKYNNFFLVFLVILNALLCLVKIENSLYSTAGSFGYLEHTYFSAQINAELILSDLPEYSLSFSSPNTYSKPASSFTIPDFNLFTNLIYNNYITVHLKSLKKLVQNDKLLIAILHKSNIWHKSSKDDPLLIV